MSENFFIDLRKYYLQVAAILRGEADSAAIFPNTTDIGQAREKVYAEFLRLHAPSKCNVFLGGFLFDHQNDNVSKQLDIIVTTDTTPRYNLHNRDGSGKSFSPVEGTLGAISIKSTLNKAELEDALSGIASIPLTSSLEGRVNTVKIMNYEDWPYKVIYATNGINGDTLLSHLTTFYNNHPEIPIHRRPNLIHVAGKYIVMRAAPGFSVKTRSSGLIEQPKIGTFHLFTEDSDLQGIIWVLTQLQDIASASTAILYSYGSLINKVNLF